MNRRKNDHDYRTSTFTGDDILDANIVDNGDGTITMTIQPKQEELAFRGEGTQGSFFEVLGDITAAVKSITVLSFTEGDASDNVKVMYKGGTGVITIDTKTKEIKAAKYVMIANPWVKIEARNVKEENCKQVEERIFSGVWLPTLSDSSEEDSVLSSSAQMVDLPAILITYTLQRGLPSPRGGFTAPSPRRPMRQ